MSDKTISLTELLVIRHDSIHSTGNYYYYNYYYYYYYNRFMTHCPGLPG